MRNYIDKTRLLFESPNSGRDTISLTVPLFLRCLEWAKEDALNDIQLHKLVENILAEDRLLDTDDYEGLLPKYDLRESDNVGPDSATIEYFAEENCASFAYALWAAHGKPINGSFAILSDPNGDLWDDFDEVFTHVIYQTGDGKLIDVRGIQTVDEIESHYHGDIRNSYEPQSFWNWAVGMSDDKPLYGDEGTVNEALVVIKQFPALYGLPVSK